MCKHPIPWKVAYSRRCPEWHAKSLAHVVDADGETVCTLPQTVGHPGLYDAEADEIAHRIVVAVNGQPELIRLLHEQYSRGHLLRVQLFPCPKCGERWTVDEWYATKQPGIPNKVQHATEVGSVEEAEDLYRLVFITLKPSYYDRVSDTYSDDSEECNLIVTGSHATCSQCRTSTLRLQP